jgi:hypothetical protein
MEVKPPSFWPRIRPATLFSTAFLIAMAGGAWFQPAEGEEPAAEPAAATENLPRSVEEARGRARWIHELVHGTLQVMHRDFFDENAVEKSLPSQSLDDVFAEMARTHLVEIRWLGGNANKGKDHLPKDRFEEDAVAALFSGKEEYDAVEGGRFRFVGMIRIQNECLKCHVRNRKSLEDRFGALAISMPLAPGGTGSP